MTTPPGHADAALLLSAQQFAFLALLGDGRSLVGDAAGLLIEGGGEVALGGLTARGILSPATGTDDRAVLAEFRWLVEPFVSGHLALRATSATTDEAGTFEALLGERCAIEYRVTDDELVSVRPTTLAEIEERTLAVLGLADAGEASGADDAVESFVLDVDVLTALVEGVADGKVTASAGLPAGAAGYAAALADARGARSLVLSRATEGDTVATMSLNWIEGGDAGLWTARAEGDARIRIRRIAPADLRAQISDALQD